jgi:hypothetical protein
MEAAMFVHGAAMETRLPGATFPASNPSTRDPLLDFDYIA